MTRLPSFFQNEMRWHCGDDRNDMTWETLVIYLENDEIRSRAVSMFSSEVA